MDSLELLREYMQRKNPSSMKGMQVAGAQDAGMQK